MFFFIIWFSIIFREGACICWMLEPQKLICNCLRLFFATDTISWPVNVKLLRVVQQSYSGSYTVHIRFIYSTQWTHNEHVISSSSLYYTITHTVSDRHSGWAECLCACAVLLRAFFIRIPQGSPYPFSSSFFSDSQPCILCLLSPPPQLLLCNDVLLCLIWFDHPSALQLVKSALISFIIFSKFPVCK